MVLSFSAHTRLPSFSNLLSFPSAHFSQPSLRIPLPRAAGGFDLVEVGNIAALLCKHWTQLPKILHLTALSGSSTNSDPAFNQFDHKSF